MINSGQSAKQIKFFYFYAFMGWQIQQFICSWWTKE